MIHAAPRARYDADAPRDQGTDAMRRDALRGHLRSALRMARLLLDEVLDPAWAREDPTAFRSLAGKAGGEMAMLLRMADRVLRDEADRDLILSLARDLAPLARAPQVRRALLMRPSRAAMHSLAHFCLTALGIPDDETDRLARRALRASASAANERVPYRLLDTAWTRHIAFGDAELDHPALMLSPLAVGVDLLDATVDDAYAFTHALPYATDFGRVALPAVIDRRRLLGIADAIAVKALDEDDLDLLAEVLMAPALLRLPWTPTLAFGWEVLQRVWSEHGFVPGPGLPPAPDDEPRADAVRRVIGTVYHTTFAAGLCCAALLACDALPPATAPAEPGHSPLPAGRGSAWQINWKQTSRATQERLAFLALGFDMRRAIEGVDLPRVQRTVRAAAAAGLIEQPVFMQAIELLERATDTGDSARVEAHPRVAQY